jgi:hypothetical protein
VGAPLRRQPGRDGGGTHRRGTRHHLPARPGTVVDGADVVVSHALRHHHETRQLCEETITLPYEFLCFHAEPRDFLNATPTGLYATTPPSP